MGLPDRDTGGLTGLRGRAGGGVGGALLAAGLGTALSSATGWGASLTMRLAGATLPLEAIVALCLARTVSVGWAPAAWSGATLAASLAAGAIGTGAGRAGAAGRASGAGRVGGAEATTGSLRGGGAASAFKETALMLEARSRDCATGAAGATGSGRTGSGSGSAGAAVGGGDGGLSSPSRCARRRTRSAWASTMLEEWDLTPILSARQRSSVS